MQRKVKVKCRLRRERHCWLAWSSHCSVVHQHPQERQQQLCACVLNKALVKAERGGRRLRSPGCATCPERRAPASEAINNSTPAAPNVFALCHKDNSCTDALPALSCHPHTTPLACPALGSMDPATQRAWGLSTPWGPSRASSGQPGSEQGQAQGPPEAATISRAPQHCWF